MSEETNLYGYAPAAETGTGIHGPETAPASFAVAGVQHAHLDERVATTPEEQKHLVDARTHLENDVQRAISNGVPLSHLPPNAAGLDVEKTYRDIAARNGTSPEQIQRKHDEESQKAMAAVQTAVFGGAALETAAATKAEPPIGKVVLDDHERPLDENGRVLSTTATLAALEQFRPQAGLPIKQREQGIQRA